MSLRGEAVGAPALAGAREPVEERRQPLVSDRSEPVVCRRDARRGRLGASCAWHAIGAPRHEAPSQEHEPASCPADFAACDRDPDPCTGDLATRPGVRGRRTDVSARHRIIDACRRDREAPEREARNSDPTGARRLAERAHPCGKAGDDCGIPAAQRVIVAERRRMGGNGRPIRADDGRKDPAR